MSLLGLRVLRGACAMPKERPFAFRARVCRAGWARSGHVLSAPGRQALAPAAPRAPRLLGGGAARDVSSKSSAKARQAKEVKRKLQQRLQDRQQRPADRPAALAPPAAAAESGTSNTAFRAFVALAGAVVIGGIAYAWHTIVDLLRKLDRVRQEAVSARGENGGVPPLSAELAKSAEPEGAEAVAEAGAETAAVGATRRAEPSHRPAAPLIAAVQEWGARAAGRLRAWLAAFRERGAHFAAVARDHLAAASEHGLSALRVALHSAGARAHSANDRARANAAAFLRVPEEAVQDLALIGALVVGIVAGLSLLPPE